MTVDQKGTIWLACEEAQCAQRHQGRSPTAVAAPIRRGRQFRAARAARRNCTLVARCMVDLVAVDGDLREELQALPGLRRCSQA